MSNAINKIWLDGRFSEPNRSVTDRLSALKGWLATAITQTADLPSEQVIAELDEVWERLILELASAYNNAPHPFKDVAKVAWEQSRDLLELRLALLSRQFGETQPQQRFTFFKKPPPTRTYSIVAAFSVLRQIFLAYSSAYRVLPKGFWALANELFSRSVGGLRAGGALRLPSPIPPAAEIYRQLLAYCLANPYSFRTGFLPIATQLLDYFSPLVRLLDTPPAQEGARGLCVVALQTDTPPKSVARADPHDLGMTFLFLQLHDLSYEMQLCAESVARGGSLPVTFNSKSLEVTRRETVEVIGSSLRAFAGIAARAIPRVPASGPIDVVSGFYNSWATLAHSGDDSTAGLTSIGNVVNQTVTGVSFRISKESELAMRVGEIMLFKRRGQPIWRVGVVRWIEVDALMDDVLIGTQALGLRSDAYTALDQDGLDIPIIVAQVPTHVGDTTVLVPDQGAGSETQLTTRDGDHSASILLTDLRETHVDCARYQFLTL